MTEEVPWECCLIKPVASPLSSAVQYTLSTHTIRRRKAPAYSPFTWATCAAADQTTKAKNDGTFVLLHDLHSELRERLL